MSGRLLEIPAVSIFIFGRTGTRARAGDVAECGKGTVYKGRRVVS